MDIDSIVREIGQRFRTFGGGVDPEREMNPISRVMENAPPIFALGVDVRDVVVFVLSMGWPASSPCGTESVEDPPSAPRAPESEALSDPTCDNDVGRCCADLWPTSPTSWCEGCLHRAASALSEVGRLQQGLRALPESEEFYNAMQTYRHAPLYPLERVSLAFTAVQTLLLALLAAPDPPTEQT